MNPLLWLFRSRKVLIALLDLILLVLAHYAGLPSDIIAAIGVLGIALIGAIALEDGAAKIGAGKP